MPLPKECIYTTDDIYALPQGNRAELIDGQIYAMALPCTKHQDISMALSTNSRRMDYSIKQFKYVVPA